MSIRRVSTDRGFRDPKLNADGKPMCRRCGGPVEKGRRSWCGEQCIHEHKIRSNPGYARRCVEKRDNGVCSSCGLDTEAATRDELLRLGFKPNVSRWQADHVRPVIEGGGECGLEGLRTLCQICHRRETKNLAARRAAQRLQQWRNWRRKMSYVIATLEVSAETYREIRQKLDDAGYQHAFGQDGTIDMHGIGLVDSSSAKPPEDPSIPEGVRIARSVKSPRPRGDS